MRIAKFLAVSLLLLAAGGCALFPKETDKTKNWSASKLYSEAKKALGDGKYETAINYFEKLEGRYPFGVYAQQAQLDVAYAYYKDDEPDSAIAAADRFIKMYPTNPHVDYAYYLKGLADFNRGAGFLSRYLPRDPSRYDPTHERQSFNDFSQLVKKFPSSRYAPDARQRMVYLRNVLAMYQIHVADYYMERGAYLAAANRANDVVKHYENSTAVPKALAIMVQAYRKLGLNTLAADALRVLKLNFPNDPALAQLERPS
ncbi:MAG: outer membrane protein assembly factor BamD [Gammaproteobacteria bacterium]|nr:outer membrane protein assembly factor BamD [Gammaproteobacteria bacterium]